MFGSVFKVQLQPGAYDAVQELLQQEATERGHVPGFVRNLTLRESEDVLWVMAVFESEAEYRKNAADPEQDKWYRRLRAHLVADPEWHDGPIVEATG